MRRFSACPSLLPTLLRSVGSWQLDLIARRARLGLLASLVSDGPALLWAGLQAEQKWFGLLCSDLEWLANGESDKWPSLAEVLLCGVA